MPDVDRATLAGLFSCDPVCLNGNDLCPLFPNPRFVTGKLAAFAHLLNKGLRLHIRWLKRKLPGKGCLQLAGQRVPLLCRAWREAAQRADDPLARTLWGMHRLDQEVVVFDSMGTRFSYKLLTDAEWQIIEPLVPPVESGGRPADHWRREVVNAISYGLRTGCQWRLLPQDLPPGQPSTPTLATGVWTEPGNGSMTAGADRCATPPPVILRPVRPAWIVPVPRRGKQGAAWR